MQEVWFDENGNLGTGVDFEDANGLDHYPSIAGAYFASPPECCGAPKEKKKESSSIGFKRNSFRLCYASRRMAD